MASLCPLQPDTEEEKKKKKKNKIGDRGAPVDHVAPNRRRALCMPKWGLRVGALPQARHRRVVSHRPKPRHALGAPFTTMDVRKLVKLIPYFSKTISRKKKTKN